MFRKPKHDEISAFTLVELIVVIAIIGVLLGLLLPAVQAARSVARRLDCSNKMKQIGLAIHNYHSVYDQFPPSKWGIERKSDGRIKHHILSFILPFMEQDALYDAIDFRFNWDDDLQSSNLQTVQTHLAAYQCPAAPRARFFKNVEYFYSDYAAAEQMQRNTAGGVKTLFDNAVIKPRPNFSGLFGMLQPPTVIRYIPPSSSVTVPWIASAASVTDGLSNTMMFFECGGRPLDFQYGRKQGPATSPVGGTSWASNASPFFIETVCGGGGMQMFNCNNNNEMFSFHPDGANFLYGDGTVRFHPISIHPETFTSLFTAYAEDIASFD